MTRMHIKNIFKYQDKKSKEKGMYLFRPTSSMDIP